MAKLNDQNLHRFIKGHFTDKDIVQYYLKKALDASRRATVAIDTSNTTALAAHTREMITNIEQINAFLGKDENTVDEKKSK